MTTEQVTAVVVPELTWDMERERALSASDSEASDYLDDSEDSEEEEEEVKTKDETLTDKLKAAVGRARKRAEDNNDEIEDDEEEVQEASGSEGDGDEFSTDDDEETRTHRYRARLVEIHSAMFSLMDTYRFLEQVTSFSPSVYKVRDKALGEVVIKICKLRSPSTRPPKEIRCMVRCQGVPGVIRLLRWHSLDDRYYAFLTPLMKDHSLSHVVGDAAKVRSYARQALMLLSACHKQGVMHRDVKPGNFFWDDDTGALTLTDFDCATTDPERLRYDAIGTRGFMSPEMRAGKGYTWKSDVYSFGVLFGMLQYGVRHEQDVTDDIVTGWAAASCQMTGNKKRQRKIKQLAEKVGQPFKGSAAAQRLLGRLLAKDPKDRSTYDEALADAYFA